MILHVLEVDRRIFAGKWRSPSGAPAAQNKISAETNPYFSPSKEVLPQSRRLIGIDIVAGGDLSYFSPG